MTSNGSFEKEKLASSSTEKSGDRSKGENAAIAKTQFNNSNDGILDFKRDGAGKSETNIFLIGNRMSYLKFYFFLNIFDFLAIIVVASIGLLFGVLCRIDCCGIKTKLCRSPTRDQIRTGEDVPLKTV